MQPPLRKAIRLAEIVIVAILAANALVTYRELKSLREIPVALPNYQFDVTGEADRTAVETRGTWIATQGPSAPMQTTTIECRKSTMKCQESSAVLSFVGDRAVMESAQSAYDIDHWDDKEIVTKVVRGPCVERTLVLSLVDRRALVKVTPIHVGDACADVPERVLELVAGYKFRRDAKR